MQLSSSLFSLDSPAGPIPPVSQSGAVLPAVGVAGAGGIGAFGALLAAESLANSASAGATIPAPGTNVSLLSTSLGNGAVDPLLTSEQDLAAAEPVASANWPAGAGSTANANATLPASNQAVAPGEGPQIGVISQPADAVSVRVSPRSNVAEPRNHQEADNATRDSGHSNADPRDAAVNDPTPTVPATPGATVVKTELLAVPISPAAAASQPATLPAHEPRRSSAAGDASPEATSDRQAGSRRSAFAPHSGSAPVQGDNASRRGIPVPAANEARPSIVRGHAAAQQSEKVNAQGNPVQAVPGATSGRNQRANISPVPPTFPAETTTSRFEAATTSVRPQGKSPVAVSLPAAALTNANVPPPTYPPAAGTPSDTAPNVITAAGVRTRRHEKPDVLASAERGSATAGHVAASSVGAEPSTMPAQPATRIHPAMTSPAAGPTLPAHGAVDPSRGVHPPETVSSLPGRIVAQPAVAVATTSAIPRPETAAESAVNLPSTVDENITAAPSPLPVRAPAAQAFAPPASYSSESSAHDASANRAEARPVQELPTSVPVTSRAAGESATAMSASSSLGMPGAALAREGEPSRAFGELPPSTSAVRDGGEPARTGVTNTSPKPSETFAGFERLSQDSATPGIKLSADAAASAAETAANFGRAPAPEKSAGRFDALPEVGRTGASHEQKLTLGSDQSTVGNQSASVGINAAKQEPFMPALAHPTPPPFAENEPMSLSAVPLTFDALMKESTPPPAELASSARRAVDSAMAMAEHFTTGPQRGVNLQFSVSGVDVAVRVEMRQDGVHTTFRTDSPELRAALAQEWNSVVTAQPADRPQRLAEPVFTSTSSSAPNSGDADASQHREPGARQNQWDKANTFAPPPSAGAAIDAAVAAVVPELHDAPHFTARHLHTFA